MCKNREKEWHLSSRTSESSESVCVANEEVKEERGRERVGGGRGCVRYELHSTDSVYLSPHRCSSG